MSESPARPNFETTRGSLIWSGSNGTMPNPSAPITPQEAERVWKSQARPSARSVATAMTRAGRPVHFTTIARWRREGLLTIATSSDSLAGMQGVRTTETAEPFAELPPPVTSLEAKRVWDEQRRPSSRRVAKALTRAGRPVHFTTVARWKSGNGKWSRGSSTHLRKR
jgi:hypothetical protein